MEKRLEKLELTVFGDGNGVPGLRMEVDRIKQLLRHARWIVALLAGQLVATVAEMLT